ncbi:hypothetical protein RchiOBHm_Chr7g0194421 [Rosa chinensis]|uniref:Uncharacterized protein n=1 Tax=Rosa chinensis TaxID=74649 RepID=A0A2P6P623_ROSCH|nr:hypothetical protein RchiOBHm_Chr7g0194421 [Rosa chinensis]
MSSSSFSGTGFKNTSFSETELLLHSWSRIDEALQSWYTNHSSKALLLFCIATISFSASFLGLLSNISS